MELRDTLAAEFGAAVAILGLLLVFLPMFLKAVDRAEKSSTTPWVTVKLRRALSWMVPATMLVASGCATTGLLTLWGTASLAKWTAFLLTATIWLVVALAATAVAAAD